MHVTEDVIVINEKDSVAVAVRQLAKHEAIDIGGRSIVMMDDISVPHKIALKEIKKDAVVYKYGYPIGIATRDIMEGEWVHVHNIRSALTESVSYEYHPERAPALRPLIFRELSFNGYKRDDGSVGIRNYIYIIPTVFCVNGPIEKLAAMADKMPASEVSMVSSRLPMNADVQRTARTSSTPAPGMSRNPNAAGVLFVGLGCEINDIESFKPALGDFDPKRIKFIIYQDVEDEFEESMKLLRELHEHALSYKREPVPISKLIVGTNCAEIGTGSLLCLGRVRGVRARASWIPRIHLPLLVNNELYALWIKIPEGRFKRFNVVDLASQPDEKDPRRIGVPRHAG